MSVLRHRVLSRQPVEHHDTAITHHRLSFPNRSHFVDDQSWYRGHPLLDRNPSKISVSENPVTLEWTASLCDVLSVDLWLPYNLFSVYLTATAIFLLCYRYRQVFFLIIYLRQDIRYAMPTNLKECPDVFYFRLLFLKFQYFYLTLHSNSRRIKAFSEQGLREVSRLSSSLNRDQCRNVQMGVVVMLKIMLLVWSLLLLLCLAGCTPLYWRITPFCQHKGTYPHDRYLH